MKSSLCAWNFRKKALGWHKARAAVQSNSPHHEVLSLSMKEHAVPMQQIWLTVCFWRPSNLSSALSSLSMLPLNKSNYIPLRSYITTRMLVRKPSKSLLKGRLAGIFLIGTQNPKIFPFFSGNPTDTKKDRNYHQRMLSCRWARIYIQLRPYMRMKPHDLPDTLWGWLFNNDTISEIVTTAHQELFAHAALRKRTDSSLDQ